MADFTFILTVVSIFLGAHSSFALTAPQFLKRPKLVVVIVIDQFRADYLTRMHESFIKPGANGEVGGFRFLMENSAYFPFAEYEVQQNMTCPGHATILTGSTPNITEIPINEWYNRNTKKIEYCVEDPVDGLSPRNLKATTVGDEVKNAGIPSKTIGIALKDRSSILLSGHRGDLAIWFDQKKGEWATSKYYATELPNWVQQLNSDLRGEHGKVYEWKTSKFKKTAEKGTKLSLTFPYGTETTIKAAQKAVVSERLGRTSGTDFLVLSLSNHDYMGHWLGPNSPEIEELTVAEDHAISNLLTTIKREMSGFNDVTIALTADHGVAPLVEDMKKVKIDAGKIDYLELYRKVNEKLDEEFGTPKNKQWIALAKNFHFYLNTETLADKKLSSEVVENKIKEVFLGISGVHTVFTQTDYKNARFPVGVLGDQIKNQFVPAYSGDLIIIPKAFYMEKDENNVTHMTGYSYDKQVPLLIMSPKVKPGVYVGGHIVDLAPTLSFLIGTIAPATSSGKVLPIMK